MAALETNALIETASDLADLSEAARAVLASAKHQWGTDSYIVSGSALDALLMTIQRQDAPN